MGRKIRVLAINPGSTTTKIALFDDYNESFRTNIEHPPDEIKPFREIQDQLSYRSDMVEKAMAENGFKMAETYSPGAAAASCRSPAGFTRSQNCSRSMRQRV